jgi:hypothetical protein
VEDAEEAVDAVERTLSPVAGDVLLAKASRGIGLDLLVERLAG